MANRHIYWQAGVYKPGKTLALPWTFGQHHKGCSKCSSCNLLHFVVITTYASNFRLFFFGYFWSVCIFLFVCLFCCCMDISVWLWSFRVQWHGYRHVERCETSFAPLKGCWHCLRRQSEQHGGCFFSQPRLSAGMGQGTYTPRHNLNLCTYIRSWHIHT